MRQKRSMVTIHDVARVAGVSVTTASRVLNDKDDVAPETYEKVRRVMQELNYKASLAAKSMRSRTTHVIGLLVPDVTDAYFQEVIKGVGGAIIGSGYDLLIYTSGSYAMHPDASWEKEYVNLLSGGLTDGCIVVSPSAPVFTDTARIVIIDPQGNGTNVPSVVARNRMGALAVMEYLVGLGHRRIGFVGGRLDSLSAVRRFQGYHDGLVAAGLPYDQTLVQPGDFSRTGGEAAARTLLQQSERPTAIFAANDKAAMGVLQAAGELGLDVPHDLSVVGFDNLPETAAITPRLTTVDQSIQQMGTIATKLLLDLIQDNEPDEKLIKVPTKLVIRDSCQAPAVLAT